MEKTFLEIFFLFHFFFLNRIFFLEFLSFFYCELFDVVLE